MGSLEAVVLLVVAAFVLAPVDVETKAILKVNIYFSLCDFSDNKYA